LKNFLDKGKDDDRNKHLRIVWPEREASSSQQALCPSSAVFAKRAGVHRKAKYQLKNTQLSQCLLCHKLYERIKYVPVAE
jgi:hypothetical protein